MNVKDAEIAVVHCYAVVYYLKTADTTVKMWPVILPTAITCCKPWGGSLGCVNHSGNLYPLKGAVWTEGPSSRGFRLRIRIFIPHIPIGNVSGSPVAEGSRE
jgi:hypothetical protein